MWCMGVVPSRWLSAEIFPLIQEEEVAQAGRGDPDLNGEGWALQVRAHVGVRVQVAP